MTSNEKKKIDLYTLVYVYPFLGYGHTCRYGLLPVSLRYSKKVIFQLHFHILHSSRFPSLHLSRMSSSSMVLIILVF